MTDVPVRQLLKPFQGKIILDEALQGMTLLVAKARSYYLFPRSRFFTFSFNLIINFKITVLGIIFIVWFA